jgi:prolyl 4-hydroxylase
MSDDARLDVANLRSYVYWVDNALAPDFCDKMVESFHQLSRFHVVSGRSHRAALEQSAWTELNVAAHADPAFKGFFYTLIERHFHEYNARLPLSVKVPLRARMEDLRIKRYRVGGDEKFQPHFDSVDEKANRYLVLLWYLNDVEVGGETEFCDLGIRVAARKGRLLMFPPYWMFQHAGLAPVSGDKYIVSTYLLF